MIWEAAKIVGIILAAVAFTWLAIRELGLTKDEQRKFKHEVERTMAELKARKKKA